MFGIPRDLVAFSEGSDFLGDSEKIKRLFDFMQKTELEGDINMISVILFPNFYQSASKLMNFHLSIVFIIQGLI